MKICNNKRKKESCNFWLRLSPIQFAFIILKHNRFIMEADNNTSLYDRLGKLEGITALVDDIIDAHMNNPVVKARFLPLKDDPVHFEEVRLHLITFLASGSGGPEAYTGKDMLTAHRGMNISEAEYMNVVDDILSVLDKHGKDEETKKDILAIAYSLKEQMIRV
ncbi:group 1 truncated hemoglobin [Limibacter armeniacum]|uniref:group I truncated hemoglobin n=1 Tax=Limibacter armeniacum TaxID=466084 RepID=UPI002FE63902